RLEAARERTKREKRHSNGEKDLVWSSSVRSASASTRSGQETEAIDRECSPNSLIGRWWEGAMRGTLSWERGMGSERAASLRSPKRKPRPVQRPYRTCNEQ
ncbi:unnamed protein product, partial [Musa banksii]